MRELQERVETALADLDQFAMYDADTLDGHEPPEPPSGAPYDGCLTCQVREALTIAVPATVEAVMRALSPETPPNGQE